MSQTQPTDGGETYKIILAGDNTVGKTSLVIHFLINEWITNIQVKRRRFTYSKNVSVSDRDQNLKKLKIEELEYAIQAFNAEPKQGIQYVLSSEIIKDTPEDKAKFLLSNKNSLNTKKLGEYLGNKKNEDVLAAYIAGFSFENMDILEALRYFLSNFILPPESNDIDRVLEIFAKEYFRQITNTSSREWRKLCKVRDHAAYYVLTYSLVLLNTDAHNKLVKHKMSKKVFVEQLIHNRDFIQNIELPREAPKDLSASPITKKVSHAGFTKMSPITPRSPRVNHHVDDEAERKKKIDFIKKDLEKFYDDIHKQELPMAKVPEKSQGTLVENSIKDCYSRTLNFGKSSVSVIIVDDICPVGQTDFSSLETSYIRQGDAFMLVFDITDRKSFENIKTYYQKIIRCKEDALIFLIGNKCDLERDRKVAYEEGLRLAKKELGGIPYFETSTDSLPLRLDDLKFDDNFNLIEEKKVFKDLEDSGTKEVVEIFTRLVHRARIQRFQQKQGSKCIVM